MTSILSKYALTDEQRRAVGERETAVAVTAGAGSGKTRALVGRYLSLLEEGLAPGHVAAITFTEKAAREMRSRIREMIRDWLAANPEEPGRSRWQTIYAEMDAAPIGTIHSLCARILRTHPAEAALDPAFEVLDENTTAALGAEAVEEALIWAANDRDAAALFSLLSEEGLRRTVAHLLQNRLDAAAAFAATGDDPLAHWRRAAVASLGEFLDDDLVQTAVSTLRALQRDGVLAALSGDKLAQTIADFLRHWDQIEQARAGGDLAALIAHLPEARRAMKPHLGRKNDWDDIDHPRDALTDLRTRYDERLGPLFKKALDWSLEEEAAAAFPQLARTFAQAKDAYELTKANRRALDFDDLEARAVDLLEGETAVRAYWREQIRAVLVDEFQDTNDRQRRIVYALTKRPNDQTTTQPNDHPTKRPSDHPTKRPNDHPTKRLNDHPTKRLNDHPTKSLFVVGDAKQSIYRFRGADVTVFRRVQRNVAEAGGTIIDLDLTFRAHAPLVGQLNALVGPVMDAIAEEERPFAIPFSPLRAYRATPRQEVAEPFIEFCLGLGENSAEGRQAAAAALAQRLRRLHEEENFEWGKMGLLFRASTGFPVYEDALEAAGIPYVTVAGRGFYERPEVRDLLNALRAIAAPRDDRAMVGLLRSPAIALGDGAIYQLRRDRDGRKRSLWATLQGDLTFLDEEDATRAEWAAALITKLNTLAGRVSVAHLLKEFLDAAHYRAILRGGGAGERAERNVEKLLSDAHASGLSSAGEFLAYVQTLRDVAAREGEAPVEGGEAVQLMTVHKAKGLQFPLVVIADAGRRGGGRPGALLLDEELGPVLQQKSDDDGRSLIYRLAAQREKEQDEAEARRLLYVAATRAEEKLLISGHVKASTAKSHPGKLLLSGWLDLLGAEVGLGQKRVEVPLAERQSLAVGTLDGRSVGCTVSPPAAGDQLSVSGDQLSVGGETEGEEWPPPLLAPVTAEPVGEEDEKLKAREAEPPPRVWRVVPTAARPRGPAWVVGTLFHEALRRWRFPDDAGFSSLMQVSVQEMGLTDSAEIEATIKETAGLLRRFQASDLYVDLAGARRLHEVPYTLEREGKIHSGIIDLLVERNGRWTVIDFKTDRLTEAELASDKIDGYREQVREYVTAVQHLPGVAAEGQLCFLNVDGRLRLETVELEDVVHVSERR